MSIRPVLALFLALLALFCRPARCDSEYDPNLPFTWLFDTGQPSSAPLSSEQLTTKDGWTLVGEENLDHAFTGDAVMLNDRLAVVLRVQGPGAEVYSLDDGRFLNRAVLTALPDVDTAASVSGTASLEIVENSPASVVVRAEFAVAGGDRTSSATFGITTGQRTVEMCPGEGAERIFAWYRPRWIVVPDFFGHDMVFDPETVTSNRFGLPAENFCLGLIRGGNAMLMTIWKNADRGSHLIPSGGTPDRTVAGYEIEGLLGEPVWFALFEGPRLWHELPVYTRHTVVDFQTPFEGKWRADAVGPHGVAHSYPFSEGSVTIPEEVRLVSESLVIYPLDRTRETPLSAFCPTDVIRNTLGVGPCQYVLQTEGLATEANPTPAEVMTWVQRQFERNRADESADEIKELMAEMVEHVGHAGERVESYARFADEMGRLLADEKSAGETAPGESSDRTAPLRWTAERLAGVVEVVRPDDLAERASALADEVVKLIGKPDAEEECRKLGDELRRIGAEQDAALSQSRMIVRWLREQSTTLAVDYQEFTEAALTVRDACRRQLAPK